MSEWKECKLCDAPLFIIDGDRGKNYPPQEEFSKSGYCLFLSTKNVRENGFDFSECQYISEERDAMLRKGKLLYHDVVLTTRGTVGNVAYYRPSIPIKNIRINSGMVIIRPDITQLFPEFNYYIFKYLKNDFLSYSSGSAQPQLPIKDLNEMLVNIPPLHEQKAIAAVLSSLDDKIDLLHRQNKTLEAMAEALFRKWFIEEADEGWEEKPLSSIANFLNGLACQKYPPLNELDKLPVLKIRELSNGITDDSDWATSKISEEYIVKAGDVIFAWSASLMVKIWDGTTCVLNQHLFKVTSEAYPKWFYFLWCKHHLTEFISISLSHATTMGHIKRGDLDNALVLIPPREMIQKMNVVIAPLLGKYISNSKQLKDLEEIRDCILPKLMSGEIRISI